MKKEKTTNNRISSWYFNLVLTFVMVALLVVVTFSWYTASGRNTVDSVTIRSSTYGELFVVDGDSLKDSKYFTFADSKLVPTCGDGDNFFYPTEYDFQGEEIMLNGVKMYVPVATEYAEEDVEELANKIITFSFKLKATVSSGKLLINPKSCVSAAEENPNSYAAAACVRVAFYVKDADSGEFVKKFVWAPNSQSEVTYYNGNMTIVKVGDVENKYVFMHDLSNETIVTTSGASSGKVTKDGVDYIWGEIPKDYYVNDVTGEISEYKIVMWIDGADRECVPAILRTEKEVDDETVWINGKVSLSLLLDVEED